MYRRSMERLYLMTDWCWVSLRFTQPTFYWVPPELGVRGQIPSKLGFRGQIPPELGFRGQIPPELGFKTLTDFR